MATVRYPQGINKKNLHQRKIQLVKMVEYAASRQNPNGVGMNKGWWLYGKLQKLLDKGWHGEVKPDCEMFPGKKHCAVFFTLSGHSRALHQLEVDIIRDFTIGSQLLHRQRGDDVVCRRRPPGRSSLATRLTSRSLFLTFRHSTSRQKRGEKEKTKISLKPYTKQVKGKTTYKPTRPG